MSDGSSCGEKDVGFEERGSVTLADYSSRLCDVDLCFFWFDLKSEVLELKHVIVGLSGSRVSAIGKLFLLYWARKTEAP